eukprot:1307435-Amphidinium_carterae.1
MALGAYYDHVATPIELERPSLQFPVDSMDLGLSAGGGSNEPAQERRAKVRATYKISKDKPLVKAHH